MYSLMVCDDEQIMIESVRHIVENEFSNIRVIETARSGREAIEKTLTVKPDIILTDIKMPGINGLDAIKEIKKVHNDIKIVIVSVYEFFEYAKQAVELGVSEYLIKPVKKERLVDTLQRIIAQLDAERRKYSWELEAKERIEKMLSAVEHSFIYSLLFTQVRKTDIIKYKKEFFDIDNETGFIFVLMFGKKGGSGNYEAQLEDSLDNQEIYTLFKDNLKYRCKCIVGPVMLDRVVVYVAQSIEDLYRQRVQAITCIEDIMRLLEEKYDIEFKVGIGRIHNDQDIMISYQEALKALNCNEGGRIVHIDDIAPNVYNVGFETAAQEHKLIIALENGDVHKCLTILSDIFRKYPNFFEQENLHYRIIEMMAAVRQVATENGINDNVEPGYFIKQILSCKTREEFERICTEEIRNIAGAIGTRKKCNIGKIVEKTNMLINERFSQDLNLDDISKELYVSPQYLSRLYKNETGENFIERLTAVRIENAKKLMKESKYSIKEICFMSGYCDPNYFSKLFKKHEGISPTTYLKLIWEDVKR
ncbi:MAG TPA: response regulator [Clostridia bacterium]|nr:response regulator [Clostridia bacterium]